MDQAVTPNKSTKSLIPTLKDKNGQLDSIQPTAVDKPPHQNSHPQELIHSTTNKMRLKLMRMRII